MPKVAPYTVLWSPTQRAYELYKRQDTSALAIDLESPAWFAWLAEVSAFVFRGKNGTITVISAVHKPIAPLSTLAVQPLLDPLSERELEVLRLIASGASNQAIADQLVVTVNTVKRHVSNVFAKLAVANRTQAIARARELNLIP